MIEPDDDDVTDDVDETLAECPKCGASVYDDIEQCPHCGEWIEGAEYAGSQKKRVFLTIVALVLLSWPILHLLFR
jgi:hypothetical protein